MGEPNIYALLVEGGGFAPETALCPRHYTTINDEGAIYRDEVERAVETDPWIRRVWVPLTDSALRCVICRRMSGMRREAL